MEYIFPKGAHVSEEEYLSPAAIRTGLPGSDGYQTICCTAHTMNDSIDDG